jgi:ketosteroid isomerase-like protein
MGRDAGGCFHFCLRDEGGAVPPPHAPPPPPLVAAAQGHEDRRHIMSAPELLRAYLSKIQDPAAVAALFAEDGVLELPQINVRVQGREEIENFIAGLLKTIPDFRLKDTQIFIETPDRAFGEYSVEAVVVTTGKGYKQTYFGRLVAEKGKIKLIREALNTLAGQRAFSKD